MYWTRNAKRFSLVNKMSNKVCKALKSKSVTLEITTYKPCNLHLVFQTHIVWHRHTAWVFLTLLYSERKKRKTTVTAKNIFLLQSYPFLLSLCFPHTKQTILHLFTMPTKSCNSFSFMGAYISGKSKTLSFLFQVHLHEAWRCLMAKLLNYFLDRSFKAMLFRASLNVK